MDFPLGGNESSLRSVLDIHDSSERESQQRGKPKCEEYIPNQPSVFRLIGYNGQQTKTEMVYQYLTGPNFRHRVEAIVEAFSSMKDDLDRERKVIMKQWEKRSKQIECVMGATVGMYGDLQGIAGKSLQEIEGLELKALDFNDEN